MKGKELLLAIMFILPLSLFSQNIDWIVNEGSGIAERSTSICVDNIGNVYITGGYHGISQHGPFVLPDYGNENIFINKYNPEGELIWAVSAGGTNQDLPFSMINDSECNIYITGFYNQNISFGDTSFSVAENDQVFLAKYDSSGVFQWARHGGSYNPNWGRSITIDANDNIYIAGSLGANSMFEDTLVFASNSLFIAKYSSEGDLLSIISSESRSHINAICCDQYDNIYATGGYNGELNLNGNVVNNPGYIDNFFIAKFNSSLINQWIFESGEGSFEFGTSICVDKSDDICFTYMFFDSTSINSNLFHSYGDYDLILGKIDTGGSLIWYEHIGGENWWKDKTLQVDNFNNIYLTGGLTGTEYFGGIPFIASNQDIFIVKYDSNGSYQWLIQGGGNSQDLGCGLSLDNNGNMYNTGLFNFSMLFEGQQLNAEGESDYYLSKIVNYTDINPIDNKPTLEISPNPASEFILISSFIEDYPLIAKIYTIRGELLRHEIISSNSSFVDVREFKRGIYILRVTNKQGKNLITDKIMIMD